MPTNWRSSPLVALTALVGVTAVWGSTFLIVQNAVTKMPVMEFLALRFSVATIVMLALRPSCLKGITREDYRRAAALGVVLGMGYITQTFGLLFASAAVSGFITGLFVVFTPVISWVLLGHKAGRNTWIAVLLASVGLAFLSLHGWSVGAGELLTVECAIFYAIHIVGLGEWSSRYNPYGFALLQIATVAVISLIAAIPGGFSAPADIGVWMAILVTAVLATAAAFLIQTWAQSLVSPTRAAVVMTMEPVFAGIFGVLVGGNQLTMRNLVGAVLVLLAMLIVQLKSRGETSRLKTGQIPG